jgi:protein-S-isoprenylcysteine O-methyltransferase Ste14
VIGAGPLCAFLAVGAYGISHSIFASRWFKDLVHQRFHPASQRFYRLAYNAVAVLTFLPVLAVVTARPGRLLYRIPSPYNLLVFTLQVMAVVVLLLGLRQTGVWEFLGLRQLVQRGPDDAQELVVTGLYRWVRHPLYSAGLLFIWLTPVMTTSVMALNLGLTLYIYIGSLLEERRLLAEFGPAYERYLRRVPRLIPIPWRDGSPELGLRPQEDP